METRPGDPKQGDFARDWETLSRDEPHDEHPGSDRRTLIRQHDGLRQRTLEITFLESDAEACSLSFG